MSAIGELLREIMPTWLTRPARKGSTPRKADFPSAGEALSGKSTSDSARALARKADAAWQDCIDEGRHAEAFPEPIPGKRSRAAGPKGEGDQKRTRQSREH
jgi:hypothetical protein